MYQAILFDLDGTLLPMDNDEFTMGYLKLLAKEVAPCGYTEESLIPAMWKGVGSMVKNDGSRDNFQAFWNTFSKIIGDKVYDDIPVFDRFYENDFNLAINYTQPNPDFAKRAVKIAHIKADKVVLATNPMFPEVAVKARINWAGLEIDDFDHVTHYLNSHYCKPNPEYYIEIGKKLALDLTKCLMVGNNTKEDIEAGQKVGMDTFLITDCMINDGQMPKTKQGSFSDFISFLEKI